MNNRTAPTTSTAAPAFFSVHRKVGAAILLGQQMAEQEAIATLAAKARVSLSRDRKSVIVDQYTRELPPTSIAVGGATVDFDRRFGTGATCGPFNEE
jgi:hypothetical protein